MRIDKSKILLNVTQSAIWLSIQGARLSSQLNVIGGLSLLMCGYGFDSGLRLAQDLHHKNQQEKILNEIYDRQHNQLAYDKNTDFTRIQTLLDQQKKIIHNSLTTGRQNIKQLEEINYARLTVELECNIEKYKLFLWQYHALATSGFAAGLTLDMLHLVLDYGIAPLGSFITLGFCMLNQVKCWAVDLNEYIETLSRCDKKINCLMHINFNTDLHLINQQLVQSGLAPLFSIQNKGEYVMQEINMIASEKQAAANKIIAHSYWYAFMLTGMSCLFFSANPIIGLGIFGSGLLTYAILKWLQSETTSQAPSSSSPFAKIIQRAREFYEIPSPSHGMALAF